MINLGNQKIGGNIHDDEDSYSLIGNFQGRLMEFVPKSKMIQQMDKKQRVEEILDEVYDSFEKIYHQEGAKIEMF